MNKMQEKELTSHDILYTVKENNKEKMIMTTAT